MLLRLKKCPRDISSCYRSYNSHGEGQYDVEHLDVVILFLITQSQHIEQADLVLRLSNSAGIMLKLKKCFFLTDAID